MTKEKTVFVVHGRNENARHAMFTFLRCLQLTPSGMGASEGGKQDNHLQPLLR